MRWRSVASAAAVAATIGCSGSSGNGAVGNTAPSAAADESPPAAPPSVALLRGFGAGSTPLADHVDLGRGVTFVAFFSDASDQDPRADKDGVVRLSERVCGVDLAARLDRLREDFKFRIENESQLACAGSRCTSSALGEYHTDATYYFATDSGKLILDAVIEVEGGPVSAEFAREGATWAEAERARWQGEGCK